MTKTGHQVVTPQKPCICGWADILPAIGAIPSFVVEAFRAICAETQGLGTARLAAAHWAEWFGCWAFRFNRHICTRRPNLWCLLTIPSPAEHILTLREIVWDLDLVNDASLRYARGMIRIFLETIGNQVGTGCSQAEAGTLAQAIEARDRRWELRIPTTKTSGEASNAILAAWNWVFSPLRPSWDRTLGHLLRFNLCTIRGVVGIPLDPLRVANELEGHLLETFLSELFVCRAEAI